MCHEKTKPIRQTNFPRCLLILAIFLTWPVVSCRPQIEDHQPTTILPTDVPMERTEPISEEMAPVGELESDEPVVITFAVEETSRSNYERLAEAFHEQNPSISIQLVTLPGGLAAWNHADLRPLASAADTMILFGGQDLVANNANNFLDLTSQMDSDTGFQPADFWPGALEACQDSDGRTLGVPVTLSFMGIFYDPAAFDAAGLPYPEPGWTWEEFRQVVTALANRPSLGTEGFADSPAFESAVLAPIIDAQLYQSGGQLKFEGLSEAAQWYLDLARSHQIYPIQSSIDETSLPHQLALWVGPLNASLPSGEDRLAIEQYKIAPFPSLEYQVGRSNVLWPTCAVVSSGTKYPRAAWEWVNFLSHQWAYEDLPPSFLNAQVPARQSVAGRIQYWDRLPADQHAAIQSGLENGWYGSVYPQAFQTVEDALLRALAGEDLASVLSTVSIAATPTPNPSPIVVATPHMPLIPEGNLVIRYLYPSDLLNGDQIYQSFVDEFQQIHPDISVQLSSDFSWPGGEVLPYLAQEFDCFYAGMESSSQTNLLYNLNPLLAREDSSFASDFYLGRMEAFSKDGQVYGLPASNLLYLIYYNADLLAQKFLQSPALDWTVDDFLRLAAAASSGSLAGPIYGTGGLEDSLLGAYGVRWVDRATDPPQVNFTQPATIEAVAWFDQLLESGVVYPLSNDRFSALNRAILAGQVAFWSGLSRRSESSSFPFTLGIAPAPALTGPVGGAGWLMGTGQFISKQSRSPEACWEWMKFVSGQPDAFPDVPARRSVVRSSDYAAAVGVELATVHDAAQTSTQKAQLDLSMGPIREWTWQALTAVYQGTDPTVTLNEAQRKAETYLQCLDDAGLLHTEILSAAPGNKTQREQIGNCARRADPSYVNPMLP